MGMKNCKSALTLMVLALSILARAAWASRAEGGDQSDAYSTGEVSCGEVAECTRVTAIETLLDEPQPASSIDICRQLVSKIEEAEYYPSKKGVSECIDGKTRSYGGTATTIIGGKSIVTERRMVFEGVVDERARFCTFNLDRTFPRLQVGEFGIAVWEGGAGWTVGKIDCK